MTVPSAGQIVSRYMNGWRVPAQYLERTTGRRFLCQSGLVRIASPTDCDAGRYTPGPFCRLFTLFAVQVALREELDPRGS